MIYDDTYLYEKIMNIYSVSGQKGFTLVEALLSITVGLLMAVISFVGFKSFSDDLNIEKEAALLKYIITTADAISASSSNYQIPTTSGPVSLTSALIIQAQGDENKFPVGTGIVGTNIWGPIGSQINVSVTSSTGTAYDLLTLRVDNLSSKQCLNLLNKMVNNIYDISVNGSLIALSPAPTNNSAGRNEINYAKASPLCAGTQKTVVFRKLKDINYATLRKNNIGTLSAEESAVIIPLYNRTEQAMTLRESAQAAL